MPTMFATLRAVAWSTPSSRASGFESDMIGPVRERSTIGEDAALRIRGGGAVRSPAEHMREKSQSERLG
jgi:hypothetical protein